MKVDIHTHILPESWPELLERYGFSAEAKERLLSGSALECVGVSRERFQTDASRAHSESL